VAALDYPHLFFLPAKGSGLSEDSVLRFEHIQAARAATVEPVFKDGKAVFPSEVAWGILQHQHHKFVTGKVLSQEIEDTLKAYRELVFASYEP
jgi:hypothetical protein